MGKHSKRSASAMERWEACAGSVKLCEGMPSIDSEAAKEGTFAHEKAEESLRGELPAQKFAELPEEMQEAIKVYTRTIIDDSCKSKNTQLFIEHHFDLAEVYPECFGTADGVIWNPDNATLYVYDFKYGKGHFVVVENNPQMLYYALGAVVTLKFPAKWVELVVVQPRCTKKVGAVRRWRVPAMFMLEFEERFIEACERTDLADPPLVPGRYCFWCPAHTKCPAKRDERLAKAIDSFSEITDGEIEEVDPFS